VHFSLFETWDCGKISPIECETSSAVLQRIYMASRVLEWPEWPATILNCEKHLWGIMAETKAFKVDEDKFNSILKRLIQHKPVPKEKIKASRKKKVAKVLDQSVVDKLKY
jgi:hypothetical protein